MANQNNNSFIYSAYAQSISAVFNDIFLEDGPSAALPVTGGRIIHSKKNIHFPLGTGFLQIGNASAFVRGSRVGSHFVSVATATVEHFNFSDVVTADLMVATVTSRYPVVSAPTESVAAADYLPSHFSIEGSKINGLKINGGETLNLVLDDPDGMKEFMLTNTRATQVYVYKGFQKPIPLEKFGQISFGSKLQYGGKVILTTFQIDLGTTGQTTDDLQPLDNQPDNTGGNTVTGPTSCSNGKNGLGILPGQ